MPDPVSIAIQVNGSTHERRVEPRRLLSDFLRHDLGLAGTHVGCEHGVCGACTVLLDGAAVRSCLLLAVQADGGTVDTVEGLADDDGAELHPLQAAFRDAHALQCGFCTPGFLMTLVPFLRETPDPDRAAIREALAGNLCRCTGYQNIVDAVEIAARRMATSTPGAAGRTDGDAAAPSERTPAGAGGSPRAPGAAGADGAGEANGGPAREAR